MHPGVRAVRAVYISVVRLIGRDRELAALRVLLDRAAAAGPGRSARCPAACAVGSCRGGDRLAAASKIIDLARAAGDDAQERSGLFWRFIALMELGRVSEAESALAAFERAAQLAGTPRRW